MNSNLHNFIYHINNIHSSTNGDNISNFKTTVSNSNIFTNTIETIIAYESWLWDDLLIWDDTDIWYDSK